MQTKTLPGDEALALALQSAKDHTNPRWILAGEAPSNGQWERDDEFDEDDALSAEEALQHAAAISAPEWFRKRRTELESEEYFDEEELLGEWPELQIEKGGFALQRDFVTGKVHDAALVFALETPASWQILARLRFGDWNACPGPEVHAAVWRHWEERYGAQIVGVSSDVVEAVVLNPPQTREAALELAWEQYLYCADIVDQGTETIRRLAEELRGNEKWFFWWD